VVAALVGYLSAVSLGGYMLGKASEILMIRLQARLVGGVLLGLAVTLPEYLFAAISTTLHHNDVALGSAFGGNIFLFTVLYGAMLTFSKPSRGGYGGLVFDLVILVVSTMVILVGSLLGTLNLFLGIALLVMYLVFAVYSGGAHHFTEPLSPSLSAKSKALSTLLFAGGLILTAVFMHPLVDQVVAFSRMVGVPPILTSFTIVPAGDELPELVALITLLRADAKTNGSNRGAQTAYANLIGSKIQSNTLLIGTIIIIASIISNPVTVGDDYTWFTLYAMVATTIMGVLATLTGPHKALGPAFIAIYPIIMVLAVGLAL
jgi:Ca2+/Na+ antiporter